MFLQYTKVLGELLYDTIKFWSDMTVSLRTGAYCMLNMYLLATLFFGSSVFLFNIITLK